VLPSSLRVSFGPCAALLLVIAAAATGSVRCSYGTTCLRHSDCASDLICVEGACVVPAPDDGGAADAVIVVTPDDVDLSTVDSGIAPVDADAADDAGD